MAYVVVRSTEHDGHIISSEGFEKFKKLLNGTSYVYNVSNNLKDWLENG